MRFLEKWVDNISLEEERVLYSLEHHPEHTGEASVKKLLRVFIHRKINIWLAQSSGRRHDTFWGQMKEIQWTKTRAACSILSLPISHSAALLVTIIFSNNNTNNNNVQKESHNPFIQLLWEQVLSLALALPLSEHEKMLKQNILAVSCFQTCCYQHKMLFPAEGLIMSRVQEVS